MEPKPVFPLPAASNDDDLTKPIALPKNDGYVGADHEDEIIARARAFDTMRDELFHTWTTTGQQGKNPDELPREQVHHAYAAMIEREREKALGRQLER